MGGMAGGHVVEGFWTFLVLIGVLLSVFLPVEALPAPEASRNIGMASRSAPSKRPDKGPAARELSFVEDMIAGARITFISEPRKSDVFPIVLAGAFARVAAQCVSYFVMIRSSSWLV